ncbi:hypothetical protein C8J56DRAFT_1166856 [Mycena floridula]|nr:hypothetical protein C8J56DRAFT_1166856 [Mycena floridula]
MTRPVVFAAADLSMDLPNELWLQMIPGCSNNSKIALCCVSKSFHRLAVPELYRLAVPELYRSITIKTPNQAQCLENSLCSHPERALWVKSVRVVASNIWITRM